MILFLMLAAQATALGENARIPGEIIGLAKVIDGDTLQVGDTRVRLHGIDAVEADQSCRHPVRGEWPCGAEVTQKLRNWIEGHVLRCDTQGTDRYGRSLARCVFEGQDVGQVLVQAGLAFAYKKYSTRYLSEERAALTAGRGLWTSAVVPPSEYRNASAPTPQKAPNGCRIKGNISADGKQIYHLPGQAYYGRTRVNEGAGERWFCSEFAARSAGWRRARR